MVEPGANTNSGEMRAITPQVERLARVQNAIEQLIEREVDLLPNGIRTVTRSDDEEVAAALVSHISGMTNRVAEKDDPRIFIQSPTLDILFERGDRIVTEIEPVEGGLAVIQTSEDPEVVAALHTHAGEVTAMADRGMDAVHEMMMARN